MLVRMVVLSDTRRILRMSLMIRLRIMRITIITRGDEGGGKTDDNSLIGSSGLEQNSALSVVWGFRLRWMVMHEIPVRLSRSTAL